MDEMKTIRSSQDDIEKSADELLAEFLDKASYEDIRLKRIVKKELINDKKIIHALNIDDMDEDSPFDYYGTYILPYYLLTDTQTEPANYICYETSFEELQRYNDVLKLQRVVFYILCSAKQNNVIDIETDIARHDLLASLIIDKFNFSNLFGKQIELISDQSRPVDNGFCARTLTFQQVIPNSITKDGRVINKLGV